MAMALLILASTGKTYAQQGAAAEPLVWCGLDYSMVKMIGTLDFRQPDQIFPEMLTEWNGLFMKEMLPQLERMAKSVKTDLEAVASRNAKATAKQIEHEDGTKEEKVTPSHITEANIAEAVRSYKLKNDTGLGLVFIMDRLVKAQETGCLHVVFFDIGSRKVVRSERICTGAGGIGFRNYWFRPVKNAVNQLPKMYKAIKAGK
jgi:hypothetical protein